MYCQLLLENISLKVNLGCLEEERSFPQRVMLQIKLQFASVPLASMTDNLHDTLCYDALACGLQEFCDTRSFKLIETLGYQLFQFLKKRISETTSEHVKVFLCVTKNPALINLEQASFVISDES